MHEKPRKGLQHFGKLAQSGRHAHNSYLALLLLVAVGLLKMW